MWSGFIGRLPDAVRKATAGQTGKGTPDTVAGHIGDSTAMEQFRHQLGTLPRVRPSKKLSLELRILASKEHARAIRYRDPASAVEYFERRLRFHMDNLMKPLAVPAVGGLVMAIICFLLLAPVYPVRSVSAASSLDVPIRLNTAASVKTLGGNFSTVENPVTLLVNVNTEGRVVGYHIANGHEAMENADTRRRIEQMLLFTVFTPATNFGVPISDQVWITVGSNNHVLVLG